MDGSAIHVLSNTEIQVVAPDVTDQLTEGQDLLLTAVTAHFTTDDDTAVESVPASVGDNLYTFGAPTVDSVAPDDGPLGGGNTITINGSGFDEPGLTLTGVNFDPNGDSEGIRGLQRRSRPDRHRVGHRNQGHGPRRHCSG